MRRLVAAAAAAAFVLAGCSSTAQTPPQPSASQQARQARIVRAGADECLDDEHQKKLVQYAPDGLGYLTGTGDTAVVLMHQSDGGLCQWTWYADGLTAKGMRGFAIDVKRASVDDAVGAVEYLRSQGVKTVYLVGASMGGTIALATAAKTPGTAER